MQRAVHTHTRETGSRGLDRKAHLSGKVICAQGHTVHSEELRFGEFRKAGIRSVTPYLLSCYLRSELQTWLKLYIGLYKCSDESVRFRLNHSGTVCPLGTFSKRISHQRQKCRYQWRATFNATSWLHSYKFWIWSAFINQEAFPAFLIWSISCCLCIKENNVLKQFLSLFSHRFMKKAPSSILSFFFSSG